MANASVGAIRLIDSDGDALDDGDGRLKVLLEAADLNIGNVDVLSIAAGDNNIGNVDIASIAAGDNNIGNVDIASIVPGTAAANLGKAEDVEHNSGDVGVMALAVQMATLTAFATDGNYVPLQVNADGALYTYTDLNTSVGATKAFQIASAAASSSQRGIVPLVKMNEVVSAPTAHVDNDWTYFQTDLNGSLYTTHGVTGGADGVTTDDTNGTVLGGDVNCKKIDIQAQTDNTGVVAVGFTGVDATIATGTGILLNAGDVYSLEINNLNLIYIESSESGEGVRYTYFT